MANRGRQVQQARSKEYPETKLARKVAKAEAVACPTRFDFAGMLPDMQKLVATKFLDPLHRIFLSMTCKEFAYDWVDKFPGYKIWKGVPEMIGAYATMVQFEFLVSVSNTFALLGFGGRSEGFFTECLASALAHNNVDLFHALRQEPDYEGDTNISYGCRIFSFEFTDTEAYAALIGENASIEVIEEVIESGDVDDVMDHLLQSAARTRSDGVKVLSRFLNETNEEQVTNVWDSAQMSANLPVMAYLQERDLIEIGPGLLPQGNAFAIFLPEDLFRDFDPSTLWPLSLGDRARANAKPLLVHLVTKYNMRFFTIEHAQHIFIWGDVDSADYVEKEFGLFSSVDLMEVWRLVTRYRREYEALFDIGIITRLISWEPRLSAAVLQRYIEELFLKASDAVEPLYEDFDSIRDFIALACRQRGGDVNKAPLTLPWDQSAWLEPRFMAFIKLLADHGFVFEFNITHNNDYDYPRTSVVTAQNWAEIVLFVRKGLQTKLARENPEYWRPLVNRLLKNSRGINAVVLPIVEGL